jgi:hypothetical protein
MPGIDLPVRLPGYDGTQPAMLTSRGRMVGRHTSCERAAETITIAGSRKRSKDNRIVSQQVDKLHNTSVKMIERHYAKYIATAGRPCKGGSRVPGGAE